MICEVNAYNKGKDNGNTENNSAHARLLLVVPVKAISLDNVDLDAIIRWLVIEGDCATTELLRIRSDIDQCPAVIVSDDLAIKTR